MWRRIADAALLGHEKRQMDTGWCRVVQESLRVCFVPLSQSLGPRLGLRVGMRVAGCPCAGNAGDGVTLPSFFGFRQFCYSGAVL